MMMMTFNENTLECKCCKCAYSWRARTEEPPRKCPSCGSMLWNSGTKKLNCIISRVCGKENGSDRHTFCFIDYVDNPEVITEDVFYITKADIDKYLSRARFPTGSAMIFIGDFELLENKELVINEMKLIYCHEKSFRFYGSLSCLYNIKSFYEQQKAEKLRKEEAMRKAVLEEERKLRILEEARQKLEQEAAKQKRLDAAKVKLSDEAISLDEKMVLIAEIEQLERL